MLSFWLIVIHVTKQHKNCNFKLIWKYACEPTYNLICVYDCVYQSMEQGCSQSAVNVVLIGHSYIRRLGEYMETLLELRNLGFSDINVHCVGVGGATLGRRRCIRNHLREVSLHQPLKIFLHTGENDLGRMSESCIANWLFCLVGELSTISSSYVVIVSQLVPFPCTRHLRSILRINQLLRRDLSSRHIFWRRESGLQNATSTLFLRDY